MDEMTAPELNAFLENLARLIEASAKTPEDAARLVREQDKGIKKPHEPALAKQLMRNHGSEGAGSLARRPLG